MDPLHELVLFVFNSGWSPCFYTPRRNGTCYHPVTGRGLLQTTQEKEYESGWNGDFLVFLVFLVFLSCTPCSFITILHWYRYPEYPILIQHVMSPRHHDGTYIRNTLPRTMSPRQEGENDTIKLWWSAKMDTHHVPFMWSVLGKVRGKGWEGVIGGENEENESVGLWVLSLWPTEPRNTPNL